MNFISITTVTVRNNPALFTEPLAFDIEYECLKDLPDDLEWKIIYVGSSESIDFDQELEKI
jgi:histone chaperone ASF1